MSRLDKYHRRRKMKPDERFRVRRVGCYNKHQEIDYPWTNSHLHVCITEFKLLNKCRAIGQVSQEGAGEKAPQCVTKLNHVRGGNASDGSIYATQPSYKIKYM